MENVEMIVLVVVVLAIVAAAVIGWSFWRGKRRETLKRHFGPEYGRAVQEHGSESKAIDALEARAKRARNYRIRHLSDRERTDFTASWRNTQAQFVDDPRGALREADTLVCRLMEARGYPMADFDRRAEDLSVDHPTVIQNYRMAHKVALADADGQASTEDLRRAFVCHRALFAELLEEQPNNPSQREVHA